MIFDSKPKDGAEALEPMKRKSRLRLVAWVAGGLLFFLVLIFGVFAWYTTTDDFDRRVSKELISTLEDATGGRVELTHTRFNLWHLAVEADGLIIHGLEPATEAPYISSEKILVRITIKNFIAHASGKGPIRYISLDLLQVESPRVHLIVNKDGSTNQPVPKTKSTSTEPVMDTLLDLQAAQVNLNNGVVLFNDKAIPFDVAANDLGIKVRYLPKSDHYGLSLGITDLRTKMQQMPEAKSRLQIEAELGRKLVELSSLTLDTGVKSHLVISGKVQNFDNPAWTVGVKGNLEVPQISVLSGFPGLTSGTLDLDLSGESCTVAPAEAQKKPSFWQRRRHQESNPASTKVLPPAPECPKGYLIYGKAGWKDAGYRDEYVNVHGVDGGAELHVTPTELLFRALTAHLPGGGGEILGEMRINNWLGEVPSDAATGSATIAAGQKTVNASAKAINAKEPATGSRELPKVGGAQAFINVTMKSVGLRMILEVTEPKNYKDLGLDTAVSGPVKVEWGGPVADVAKSVVVNAELTLAPTGARRAGAKQNIPVSGVVQAEYRGDRQVVNITNATLKTPATTVVANGVLGVNEGDPLTHLTLNAGFRDLGEFDSILNSVGYEQNGKTGSAALPVTLHGQADFRGTAGGPIKELDVKGHLDAQQVEAHLGSMGDIVIDSVVADAEYAPRGVTVGSSTIKRGTATLNLAGAFTPHRVEKKRVISYEWDDQTQIDASVQLADASMKDVLDIAGQGALPITGTAAANIHAKGSIQSIVGSGNVSLRNGVAYNEPFDLVSADLTANGQNISVSTLQVKAQGVAVMGNGDYNIASKHLRAHLQGNNIRLSTVQAIQREQLPVDGVLTFNADADGTVEQPGLRAHLQFASLTLNQQALGQLTADVHSQADTVYLTAHSDVVGASFDANGQIQLAGNYPMRADLKFANLNVAPILTMTGSTVKATSLIAGQASVSGPAKTPQLLNGTASIDQFKVSSNGIELTTAEPIRASLSQGTARLDQLHIIGQETNLNASGSVQLFSADGSALPAQGGKLSAKADGAIDLGIIHRLNPNIRSNGKITLNVSANGTTKKPVLGGKVQFANANLAMADIPNGISNLNGIAEFTEDRLQAQNITGESGGGKIKLGGFLQYRNGLFADMTLTADTVRVRYYGVSSTMNANIRLQGTGDSAVLGGNILIMRFGLAETFDFASVAGGASDVTTPPDPDSLLNKIRLQVDVKSAPALDFQNSYAKIAGTVDLGLRGTLGTPSVLGKITITDGSANFAGTQYQLQRGQIYFNNPVRIDPTIDLDATARVENYDVSIGVHGTSKNFKLSYRSEPPLSQADIFNLLALGRTQEEAQINSQQLQQQGQDPATNAILGGALNATVSNRVNKLFGGAGKVKIDPAFVGTLGTSSARITVEQQLNRQITVVFATTVNATAQQLIQVQYQLSDNKSIVATRDENGVFSVVYKIRKRYR